MAIIEGISDIGMTTITTIGNNVTTYNWEVEPVLIKKG